MRDELVVVQKRELERLIEQSVRLAVSDRTKEIKSAMDGLYVLKEWLTVDEASSYLGIARKTMMDWKDKYEIPHQKRGQQIYFKRALLDSFIEDADEGRD